MNYETERYYSEARRNIHEFLRAEYGEDVMVNPEDTFIPIAYSTIDDRTGFEHIWQAYADLNRDCITHVIDGMFEQEDRFYSHGFFLAGALECLEWDWLYSDGCELVAALEAKGVFKEV